MIFVTVGSDLAFSRLVEHADLWSRDHPDESVFAQVGLLQPSDYVPRSMDWEELLPADEFDRRCAEARLIVAHAGMGSIISALAAGKPIVILPRRAHLRETRSDHQFATAERFSDRPGIFVAWTEADLSQAICRALTAAEEGLVPTLPKFAPVEFTGRLRDFIMSPRGSSLESGQQSVQRSKSRFRL